MGIIPDELVQGTSKLINAFNGAVFVSQSDSTIANDGKAFIIEFDNLSKEACITLATNDWGSGFSSGLIAIQASGTSATTGDNLHNTAIKTVKIGNAGSNGTNYIATPGGSTLSVPMSVVTAAQACACNNGNTCSIAWKYY